MIQTKGVRLSYEDHGEGLPVVLLHAFPFSRQMWQPQVEGLRGDCRLILPDLRGFGTSESTAAVESLDTYAQDVAALLDHLGVDRAVVGGLSMGGYITLAFARLFPQRLLGAVLADTRAGADTEEGRAAREATAVLAETRGAAPVAEQMLPKLINHGDPSRSEVTSRMLALMRAAPPAGIAAASRAMAGRPDSFDVLRRLACSVLVLVGTEDRVTPPEEARKMVAAAPHSRLVEIPGAGHLSNLEQPDRFNEALRSFLASLPQRER